MVGPKKCGDQATAVHWEGHKPGSDLNVKDNVTEPVNGFIESQRHEKLTGTVL